VTKFYSLNFSQMIKKSNMTLSVSLYILLFLSYKGCLNLCNWNSCHLDMLSVLKAAQFFLSEMDHNGGSR
jgi:hypothetical protein